MGSTISDGSSMLSSAGGSSSEVGVPFSSTGSTEEPTQHQPPQQQQTEEEWVAVQRKKKSGRGDTKVKIPKPSAAKKDYKSVINVCRHKVIQVPIDHRKTW